MKDYRKKIARLCWPILLMGYFSTACALEQSASDERPGDPDESAPDHEAIENSIEQKREDCRIKVIKERPRNIAGRLSGSVHAAKIARCKGLED